MPNRLESTDKPLDFDVSHEYSMDTLVKELNNILPAINQYSITPIGPAGGNPMVRVYFATPEQLTKLQTYVEQSLQVTELFGY